MTGSSTQGIKTVLHPVSDLATAKAVYAAAHDVGGGRLVATVTDPDGNVLGLLQTGECRPLAR
jgi:predicted enzyme related to lactoylglutathione lyase